MTITSLRFIISLGINIFKNTPKSLVQEIWGYFIFLVETRGVEPLSKSPLYPVSPSAAIYLGFSLRRLQVAGSAFDDLRLCRSWVEALPKSVPH